MRAPGDEKRHTFRMPPSAGIWWYSRRKMDFSRRGGTLFSWKSMGRKSPWRWMSTAV
nr:MAG TPA: hypothetical protein [Caudoviricetes sp.]